MTQFMTALLTSTRNKLICASDLRYVVRNVLL